MSKPTTDPDMPIMAGSPEHEQSILATVAGTVGMMTCLDAGEALTVARMLMRAERGEMTGDDDPAAFAAVHAAMTAALAAPGEAAYEAGVLRALTVSFEDMLTGDYDPWRNVPRHVKPCHGMPCTCQPA